VRCAIGLLGCAIGPLGRPVSEPGRLRHGDGGHGRGDRRRTAFMLLTLAGRRSCCLRSADWRACSAPNNLSTALMKADSPFLSQDEKPVSELKATVRLRIP
jgi:hypothetical protein